MGVHKMTRLPMSVGSSGLQTATKKLTPQRKAKAKAAATRVGRKYPNLVDNMNAAKEHW
jgi:ribosomal protein L15E